MKLPIAIFSAILALFFTLPWREAGAQTTIDWELFGGAIRGELNGKVTGWAYAIGEGSVVRNSDAGGYRRLPVNGGLLRFNVNTKGQALSTTKTLTAIALVKALEDRGLTVDEQVMGFLPSCWDTGPGVDGDEFSFRRLLDHTSGLPASTGAGYEGLKQLIANGVTGTVGSYVYSNAAYTLMRYLVPLVAREAEAKAAFTPSSNCQSAGDEIDHELSDMFSDYLIGDVLVPAGVQVDDITLFTPPTNFAYLYNRINQNIPGVPPNPNSKYLTGAGRVAISVVNYKKVLAALDQGVILPSSVVDTMYTGNLGFDGPVQGKNGTYYTKAGGVSAQNVAGGAQLMIYPNGVHAYVMVNSTIVQHARWYIDHNRNGSTDETIADWGLTGDTPIVGDFDGDRRVDDLGVFRSANHRWYFDYNHDGTTDEQVDDWGLIGDKPVAGDFDHDGRVDDTGVARASGAGLTWYFDYDHDGTTDAQIANWGLAKDLPLAGDFDGDGRVDDIAVTRSSGSGRAWFFDYNRNGTTDAQIADWDLERDIPLAGDFDRDGRMDDIAVYRPSSTGGAWFFDFNHDGSTDGTLAKWGISGDRPVAGDFDADGRVDDLAVVRIPKTSLRQVLAKAYDGAVK